MRIKKLIKILLGTAAVAFLGFFLLGLIVDPPSPKNSNVSTKPENYVYHKPALFLDSMPPDYSITAGEESEFEKITARFFSEPKLSELKSGMQELKNRYPEGYFVIVQVTISDPDELRVWYEEHDASFVTMVHEMTHSASTLCRILRRENCETLKRMIPRDEWGKQGYFIEDKGIVFSQAVTDIFVGEELLKYIAQPNEVDEIYLREGRQTIFVALDEINAYIKSVRMVRAYNQADRASLNSGGAPEVLSRQLYYLSLYLREMKSARLDLWRELTRNKAFAFVLMRLDEVGRTEVQYAAEEGLTGVNFTFTDTDFRLSPQEVQEVRENIGGAFGGTVADNLELYNQNRSFIDEFLEAADVKKFENTQLSLEDLQKQGVGISVILQ